MMRYVRRTFRQWRNELLAFWSKFNTFYRMVFAIVIAMVMVVAARRELLDSRQQSVKALDKELKDKSVPLHVPTPESDNDVQEAELLAENLLASLERERHETQAVIEQSFKNGQKQARDTLDTLTRLIAKHGLLVRTARRYEPEDEFPLARLSQICELSGDFVGVYKFLSEIGELKAPCRIRNLELTTQNPQSAQDHFSKSSSNLTLSFIFESFYVEF